MTPFAPPPKLNEASSEPSSSNRAMKLRATPLTAVKYPATMIRPSFCTASAETLLFGPMPGLNVGSTEPSTRRRARFVRPTPLMVSNTPPIKMRLAFVPPWYTASARTVELVPRALIGPASNVVSSVPSRFSRATLVRLLELYAVKSPPITMAPLVACASAKIGALAPVPELKLTSREPPGLSLSTIRTVAFVRLTPAPPVTLNKRTPNDTSPP